MPVKFLRIEKYRKRDKFEGVWGSSVLRFRNGSRKEDCRKFLGRPQR